jgi:AcrR family transcriptional regulator
MTDVAAVRTPRERIREEMTREITEVARRHLAQSGPAALSLRAVARDVGMVSSAVYRYFPSRDELLTTLIIEAYDDLAATVEQAESAVRRRDLAGRWRAICTSVRRWAIEHPHEYSLLYGTPVPGYAAPRRTVAAAARVPTLLLRVLADLRAVGRDPGQGPGSVPVPRKVRAAITSALDLASADVSPDLMARGLLAWTWLFGAVSFELFGHLVGSVDDPEVLFGHQVDRMARVVGLT